MTEDLETKIFVKRFRSNEMNSKNYNEEISNQDITPGRTERGKFRLKNLNK